VAAGRPAVTLFPIVSRQGESIALACVVGRSMEAALIVDINLLSIVPGG
jgi:hypothetical protein